MKDVLNEIVMCVVPVLITIIGTLASVAVNRLAVYIKTKTTNKNVEFAIERLSCTTDTVVAALTQTVVADVKKASEDGKLSSDDAKRIKDDAKNEILKIINKDVVDIIKTHIGDFDGFISSKIEQAVAKLKP